MNAQEAAARPKKILVVDDNPVILKTLSLKLKSKGYDVATAMDGSGTVSAVRKERPDLILLDILFPPDVAHGGGVAWDGVRIIEWLRRFDEARNIPIIIISGADPAKYKGPSLAAGAVAFFSKPIDSDELLAAIRKVLGDDGSGGPPKPATNLQV
jgi:CheY-like chemotaxis protein